MSKLHRLGFVALVLILCVGCDQVVKAIAKESLISAPPISLLGGFIRIEYAENLGAFLGLGAELPGEARLLASAAFAGLILAITLAFALRAHSLPLIQLAALSLVAAGGIGNFVDRLFNNGAAIDFVKLGIDPISTAFFNVADVAIVAGVSIFLLFGLKDQTKQPSSDPDEPKPGHV